MHDLRVDPRLGASRAASDLIGHAARCADVTWAFSVILDSNPHQRFIARAAERALGSCAAIGKTAHVGRTLEGYSEPAAVQVRELGQGDWERSYWQLAARHEFSSAEPSHWRDQPGTYLGAFSEGRLLSLCKAVSGQPMRSIHVAGSPVALGYLAFLLPAPNVATEGVAAAFAAWLRRSHGWQWLFVGEAVSGPPITQTDYIRFTSTCFVLGDYPSALRPACHELTLI
ncbi:MAG: hypothetical protein QM756_38950 [Polyangiaceae bacterium]